MRAYLIIAATAVALLAACAMAGECQLVNSSFEDDGIIDPLGPVDPNGWTSDIPENLFDAYIRYDWVTEGSYNLTMTSVFNRTFTAGDAVTLSQDVDLAAVEKIAFDLQLATAPSPTWNNAEAAAVLMIDGEVVWDSNDLGPDPRGEHVGLEYFVEPEYRTVGLHTVSVGLMITTDIRLFSRYIAHWDNLSITCYCGGGGLLAGDFDRDCDVDANDLASLASVYLLDPPIGDVHNLYDADDIPGEGGMVNFYDLAAMIVDWDGAVEPLAAIAANWLEDVAIDSPANMYAGNDIAPAANINFLDYVLMLENWLESSLIVETEEPQQ